MRKALVFVSALGATLALGAAAHGDPVAVKAGVLNCNVSGGWGLVLASTRDLQCSFAGVDGETDEYRGRITNVGVDVGYYSGGVMIWAVLAPAKLGPGALSGHYGGVSGSAAAGVGAGANVLVGGSESTVSLQPVSIEGDTGLNFAGGVTGIELQPR
jgi:hypothetical protein